MCTCGILLLCTIGFSWSPSSLPDKLPSSGEANAGTNGDRLDWIGEQIAPQGPADAIVINEVLAHSDPPLEDAIELYNDSDRAVRIGGWFLSDIANQPKKFRIPDGTVLQPHGHVVFYEYQFDPIPGRPPSFGLSEHGDEIHLSSATPNGDLTGYTTSVRFKATGTNLSIGRIKTSVGVDFANLSSPTFGVSNPTSVRQFRTGEGAPNTGPRLGSIIINEVMYHPSGTADEYVELLNISKVPVPLYDPLSTSNTWRVKEGISYRFPPNTVVPAGSYLLLVPIEPAMFRLKYSIPSAIPVFGPYEGNLSNSGEPVELAMPDQEDYGFVPYVTVDRVEYDDDPPWPASADGGGPSLERLLARAYGNEPRNWAASQNGGTPGRANNARPISDKAPYLPLLARP